MLPSNSVANESSHLWIVVRPQPAGQFTAQLLGLPELAATAANRDEASEQIRLRIGEWVAEGRLVSIEGPQENPLLRWFGHADPKDPSEQAYLAELKRLKVEDLERTLREYEREDQQCSGSSSTPTT
jgi:hypothetical protein